MGLLLSEQSSCEVRPAQGRPVSLVGTGEVLALMSVARSKQRLSNYGSSASAPTRSCSIPITLLSSISLLLSMLFHMSNTLALLTGDGGNAGDAAHQMLVRVWSGESHKHAVRRVCKLVRADVVDVQASWRRRDFVRNTCL